MTLMLERAGCSRLLIEEGGQALVLCEHQHRASLRSGQQVNLEAAQRQMRKNGTGLAGDWPG